MTGESSHAPRMRAIIERKKAGLRLSADELATICNGAVAGSIPDYQLAAWLMAVWFRGLDATETLELTRAMVATGRTLDWTGIDRPVVDKHSTGGVGDKTSLVLVPLVAAAGLAFVKMSGRGLGLTGGTIDKLEAIPGFRVELAPDELRRQVERIGCALVSQSPDLVPADGVLYALRDVTATVDSVPLIASSVMSKKLAAGAGAIVLDVKYGAGAFMGTIDEARELARTMVRIGTEAGRRVRAVISPMHRPLGRAVGNALEVEEAIETLRGEGPADLWELALQLGAQLMTMSGVSDPEEAAVRLRRIRDSGEALQRLRELVEAQGGDPSVVDDPDLLPSAPIVTMATAPRAGWVAGVDAGAVAEAVLRLGGGREVKGAAIDPAVGVVVLRSVGERVEAGEPLAEVHARSEADVHAVLSRLASAFSLVDREDACPPEPELEWIDDS
ncbi:MAG TPA: thymidine phosphorylase [Longimicrobiaceae bacterium]